MYYAVERFHAVLSVTLDVHGPTVTLGHVALTGVAGTARLHTNKEVCMSYLYFTHHHSHRGRTSCIVTLLCCVELSVTYDRSFHWMTYVVLVLGRFCW